MITSLYICNVSCLLLEHFSSKASNLNTLDKKVAWVALESISIMKDHYWIFCCSYNRKNGFGIWDSYYSFVITLKPLPCIEESTRFCVH